VTPNRTHDVLAYTGWPTAPGHRTGGRVLAYYEEDCPSGVVRGALPNVTYEASWFDPRKGEWLPAGPVGALTADRWGRIAVPSKPSDADWGLRLLARLAGERGDRAP